MTKMLRRIETRERPAADRNLPADVQQSELLVWLEECTALDQCPRLTYAIDRRSKLSIRHGHI